MFKHDVSGCGGLAVCGWCRQIARLDEGIAHGKSVSSMKMLTLLADLANPLGPYGKLSPERLRMMIEMGAAALAAADDAQRRQA
jgi:hypothetical protein